VFDASAVIALLRDEAGAERLAGSLRGNAISAVNLAELVAHAVRSGTPTEEIRADFARLDLAVHSFDEDAAVATGHLAAATRRLGLSLGDRACLALAKKLGATAVTADRAWAKLDLGIPVEIFR